MRSSTTNLGPEQSSSCPAVTTSEVSSRRPWSLYFSVRVWETTILSLPRVQSSQLSTLPGPSLLTFHLYTAPVPENGDVTESGQDLRLETALVPPRGVSNFLFPTASVSTVLLPQTNGRLSRAQRKCYQFKLTSSSSYTLYISNVSKGGG